MKGYFDENNRPRVDVKVAGMDSRTQVSALIDTGFEGSLMLSLPSALAIGLKLVGVVPIELADGSIRKEFVFEGSVVFGKRTIPVEIFLTTGEDLLGTALLQKHMLTIDFPRRRATITPSS